MPPVIDSLAWAICWPSWSSSSRSMSLRAREHLCLLLLGVVLHEVLQDLGLGGELVGAGIDLLDLGKDHIDDVVLLEGLVVELLVVLLRGGVADGGIEDLLLDLRVDLEFLLDAFDQGC